MDLDAPEDIPTAIGLDLLRWAGLANHEGEITDIERAETFADTIQSSSIPEACGQIMEGLL